MSNLFSANSYLWPVLVGLGGLFLLAVVGFVIFAALATSKKATPVPVAVPVQTPAPTNPHLAQKRLTAVLVQSDLHSHDRTVLDAIAANLEPGPITKEGQKAQLQELLAQALEAKAEKPE